MVKVVRRGRKKVNTLDLNLLHLKTMETYRIKNRILIIKYKNNYKISFYFESFRFKHLVVHNIRKNELLNGRETIVKV